MPTSIEGRKESIIMDLVEACKDILNAVSILPARQREVVFLGSWSVLDLLAHLVGWDYTNVEAVQSILFDRVPGFFAFYDEDWRTYNSRLVAQYKVKNFSNLVKAMEKSHGELIKYIHSIPAQEYDKDRGLRFDGDEVTIADLLQTELNDERMHFQQIAEFRRGKEKKRFEYADLLIWRHRPIQYCAPWISLHDNATLPGGEKVHCSLRV